MKTIQEKCAIFVTITSCRKIMTSWRIIQKLLRLRSIKTFNFVDFNKILKIVMKIIYLGTKSETVILHRFPNCQLILLKFGKFPDFCWKNTDVSKTWGGSKLHLPRYLLWKFYVSSTNTTDNDIEGVGALFPLSLAFESLEKTQSE